MSHILSDYLQANKKQPHFYGCPPGMKAQATNPPPYCDNEGHCGLDSCAADKSPPPGFCDDKGLCGPNFYCMYTVSKDADSTNGSWVMDANTGVCKTVADIPEQWCYSTDKPGTCSETLDCFGLFESKDECISAGGLPGGGPTPMPNCQDCAGGGRCCPVPKGSSSGTSQNPNDCCESCIVTYQCGAKGCEAVKGSGGPFKKPEDCKCYKCQVDGSCGFVPAGQTGDYNDDSECKCTTYYTCGEKGQVVKSATKTLYQDPNDVPCFECNATLQACHYVQQGNFGTFKNSSACTCWGCSSQGAGGCGYLGNTGKYTSMEQCNSGGSCKIHYTCDGDGNIVSDKTGKGPTSKNFHCYTCEDSGASKPVPAGQVNGTCDKESCLCWGCSSTPGVGCVGMATGGEFKDKPTCESSGTCTKSYICGADGKPTPGTGPNSSTDASSLNCFECNTTGACVPVAQGGKGSFSSSTSCTCFGCLTSGSGGCGVVGNSGTLTSCENSNCDTHYTCDGKGNVVEDPTGQGPTDKSQVKCFKCDDSGKPTFTAKGTSNGTCSSRDACLCWGCSTSGLGCVVMATGGAYTSQSECESNNECTTTWYCDTNGKPTKGSPPDGGQGQSSESDLKCFECDGKGSCVVNQDGDGTFTESGCGNGCWKCTSTSSKPVPSYGPVTPAELTCGKPGGKTGTCCEANFECYNSTDCCPNFTGKDYTKKSCKNQNKETSNDCCPSGYTCSSTTNLCEKGNSKKKSSKTWLYVGIGLGAVVIIVIGIVAGVIHHRKSVNAITHQEVLASELASGDTPPTTLTS